MERKKVNDGNPKFYEILEKIKNLYAAEECSIRYCW